MKCPLCNSKDTKIIYEESIKQIISNIDDRNPEIGNEIRNILNGDNCKFMKCVNCSFSFSNPFRGGTTKLYSLIYGDNYPSDRLEYDLALKEISKEDTCLEIGAGSGFFLKKLSERYDNKNLFSVEVSNDKSNFKDINDIPDNMKFSVVCMFQVLEHLDNFKEVINKINKITTENSKLIISVPEESSVEFFRQKIGLCDNPPIHVSRWNKDTISRLDGWEIKDYRTNALSKFMVFKNLFYGIRTIKYTKTRNLFLLFKCFFEALIKFRFNKLIESQYFCLIRTTQTND